MQLKTIEICGFKSFGTKNVLDFFSVGKQKGVAAVIGPNGSGKSNIADAIRWVLGEQSPKILRVKKNEEVIFSGNAKKGKSSFVEVAMTLDTEGSSLVDFREVEVARRLYRNGENEYFLNKKRVRLLDILELLSRCGFGHSTYTVIGQGMIDSLLFYGPAERKVFFEEASGVKHYEIKREQAMRKLESTEKNMVRIKDLLYELEPRLAVAKRQYSRYENKQGIEEKLFEISRDYYRSELAALTEDQREQELTLTQLQAEEKTLLEKIRAVNSEIESQGSKNDSEKDKKSALSRELENLYKEKEDAFRMIYEKQAELKTLDVEAEIRRAAQECESHHQTLNSLTARRDQLQITGREITAALELEKSLLFKTDEKLAALESEIEKLQEEAAGLENKEVLKRLDDIRKAYGQFREQFQSVTGLKELMALKKKDDLTSGKLEALIRILRQSESFDATKLEEVRAGKQAILRIKEESLKKIQDLRVKELSQKEIIRNLEATISEVVGKLDTSQANLNELKKKNTSSEDKEKVRKIAGLEKKKALIEEKISQVKRAIADYEEKERNLDRNYSVLYQNERDVQNQMTAVREKINSISYKLGGLASKSQDLKREITEDFNEEFLKEVLQDQRKVAIEPKRLEKMLQLKKQCYALGEIDPFIKDEYEDLSRRVGELSVQFKDLESAKNDLAQVTEELDRRIKTQFNRTFKEISAEFTGFFKILFGGGEASLALEHKDDGFGVEINATPPGKKNQSLASLSGGERTLTSIALLFAILSVNPSPFCVLDEVDAALDEFNTQKFLKILKTIAKKSQFILITHNRETMKEADVIYGVTMDENHISKTYSLRLSEAVAAKE